MIAALALLVATTATGPAPGPDRLIACTLGRVTNMAARTPAELGLVGSFRVAVFQPDAAIERADRPEPELGAGALVKLHDPDHVLPPAAVNSVLDKWPVSLEFLAAMPDGKRAFVSLGQIDVAAGTATGSAGVVNNDGATLVPGAFLQGRCTVRVAPNLAADFARLKESKR